MTNTTSPSFKAHPKWWQRSLSWLVTAGILLVALGIGGAVLWLQGPAKLLLLINVIFPPPEGLIAERHRLWEQAQSAANAGNHREAAELGQRALSLLVGKDDPKQITLVKFIARQWEAAEDWGSARAMYDDALQRTIQAYGKDDSRVTNAIVAIDHLSRLQKLTPEKRQRIRKANAEAFRLYQQGQSPAAIELAKHILDECEQLLGADHPLTANCLNNLAGLYHRAQGNYAAAEPLYQRALKINEQTFGPDHLNTATSIDNLAELYQVQGNKSASSHLYERSLKIREETFGFDHPETAMSVDRLASLYDAQANYAAAEVLYKRAIKIREEKLGLDHSRTVLSLISLANFYQQQGDYAAAEPLNHQVVKIYERTVGPDHRFSAMGIHNLANVYEAQANYARAEPLYQRALSIAEKTLGPDHRYTAMCFNNLGGVYADQGNYATAEPLIQRAQKIYEKALGPNHPDTAYSLNNLAAIYRAQGNYAAAEPLYQRALKIREAKLGPDHHDTAYSLCNLAAIYKAQGNETAAEPLLQRALKILEEKLGPDHHETANSLNHLAELKWQNGDVAAARSMVARTIVSTRHYLEKSAAVQTERQQLLMGNANKNSYHMWLTVTSDGEQTHAAWESLVPWKGQISARQHQLRRHLQDDSAYAAFRQKTQQLSSHMLNPPSPPSDPKDLVAWRAKEPELIQAWLKRKAELEAEHENIEKELAKKSASYRQLQQRRDVTADDILASLRQAPDPTALVDLMVYHYSGRKSQNETSEARIAAFVVRPDREINRVELGAWKPVEKLIAAWRQGYGRPQNDDFDPGQELRQKLWAPLEPYLDGITTVLISPDRELGQLPWGALPGARLGTYLLEGHRFGLIPIPQMMPELLGRKPSPNQRPASLLLVGGIDYGRHPMTSPEPTPSPPSTLTESLALNRSAIGRGTNDDRQQFNALPGTEAEIAQIAQLYGSTKHLQLLTGRNATEHRVRAAAEKHAWLHLATHGYFAPAELTKRFQQPFENRFLMQDDKSRPVPPNPALLSGLVFAGVNTEPEIGQEDGIATALEIGSDVLDDVEMVVLSACETGLGAVAGGEGLLGLQRSFQIAGAKTVVATLWQVDDNATQSLMTEFYHNLWDEKLPRLEALRQAQLKMLHDYDPKTGELRGAIANLKPNAPPTKTPAKPTPTDAPRGPVTPFHWAAFVLSGDWR